MTNRQRWIVWSWIAALIGMGVYAPWHMAGRGYPFGYHFIFAPPHGPYQIDAIRLAVEWIMATIVALGFYFAWPLPHRA